MINRTNVPCNGCTACCRGDAIFLHPECGDVVASYETSEDFNPLTKKMEPVLKRDADNNCVYLGPAGCTIHERAPVICREFDCRLNFLKFPRSLRRRMVRQGFASQEVFDAGRQRLGSLK
jgi:hypothetical protein